MVRVQGLHLHLNRSLLPVGFGRNFRYRTLINTIRICIRGNVALLPG